MKHTRRRFLKSSLAASLVGIHSPGLLPCIFGSDDSGVDVRVDRQIGSALERAPLSMQFRGTTADECRRWQQAFRAKLGDLLGEIAPPKQWRIEEENRRDLDDHIRIELLLRSDGVPSVPVYLLLPKTASANNKVPGVVCVHGHGAHGHHPVVGRTDLAGVRAAIASAHYDYGLQFVRRGFAVAAPCLLPFGRRLDREKYGRTDPCAVTFVRMQALGQLPIASNLRDLSWCVDLLQSRSEVRADRIGCAGLSYGGRMTMMVSAMDRRIKVACVSGALNLLQERITVPYSCGSQIVPGLLKYGDYSEIGSLIAPRPCVWEVGSKDGLIPASWAALFRKRLKRAYQAYAASENLQFDEYEGGHRWNGELAYPLFEKVLMKHI